MKNEQITSNEDKKERKEYFYPAFSSEIGKIQPTLKETRQATHGILSASVSAMPSVRDSSTHSLYDDRDEDEKKETDSSEKGKRKIRPVQELFLIEADYGILPDTNPAHQLVQGRLRTLLPNVPNHELPKVEVLASRGGDINAFACENWTIVVTPELLQFVETEEELDYVLLHEVNHLLNEDHDQLERSSIRDSLRRSLGAQRMGEYRADIQAFNQAAELERHSNPLGAIRFLERLREKQGHDKWEPVHGKLTDRILNLKSVTGLLELDRNQQNPLIHRLTESLTPIEKAVQESAVNLKEGGYLVRLLDSPPLHGRAYDQWERDTRMLLEKADLQLLHATLPTLFRVAVEARVAAKKLANGGNRGITAAEARHDCYKHLLHAAFKRWDSVVEEQYRTLSPADRCTLKVSLLEACLRVPVFTVNATEERSLVQMMEAKVASQNARMGGIAVGDKDFSDFDTEQLVKTSQLNTCRDRLDAAECIEDTTFLKRLKKQFDRVIAADGSHALAKIGEQFDLIKVPCRRGDALRYIAKLAKAAVADYACFDTDEHAIDHQTYLELSAQCLAAADAYEERKSFADRSLRQYALPNAWTEILLNGAFTLADLGQLDEKYAATATVVSTRMNEQLGLESFKFQSQQSYENYDRYAFLAPGAAAQLREYVERHWGLEIQTLRSRLQRLTAIREEVKAGVEQGADVASQKDLLQEASRIMNELPPLFDLQEAEEVVNLSGIVSGEELQLRLVKRLTFIEGYMNSLFFFEEKESTNRQNLTAAVCWAQTVVDNDRNYKKLANDFMFDRVNVYRHTLSDLDAVADSVTEFSTLNPYGERRITETAVDLRKDLFWQDAATVILGRELKTLDVAGAYFALLERYLRRWKVAPPNYRIGEEEDRPHKAILEKGGSMLNLTEASLSRETLERLLRLSFFVEDVTLSRPIQEYVVSQLLREATFDEALELTCKRYKAQGILGAVDTLKILEQKAQTPEQLRKLLETLQNMGTELDALTHAGEAVIAEGAVEVILRRKERLPFLIAMLKSSRDESELKQIITDTWFWVYEGDVRENVQRVSICEDKQQLEAFAASRPRMVDNPTETVRFPRYQSPDAWRGSVYRLGILERYAVLRKLLTDHGKGALIGESRREDLLSSFLDTYLQQDSTDQIEPILRKVLGAVMHQAPMDELSMVLIPLLKTRIANPPKQLTPWESESHYIAQKILPRIELPEWVRKKFERKSSDYVKAFQRAETYVEPYIARHIEYMLLGHSPEQFIANNAEDRLLSVVPTPSQYGKSAYSALEMTLDIAQNFGAPGVRFLQLLGQSIPLGEKYRKPFSAVYDAVEGQSKLSAWETIKNIAPDYAAQVQCFNGRVGGGSLFSVYMMHLTDGTKEVARVLNPNAWYHAQKFIHVIRESLQGVAKDDPRYEKTLPLLDLIEQWIRSELEDQTYEKDDDVFFKNWNNWKPNRRFRSKVVVPKSSKTGTNKVRREEYMEGENFTHLSSFELDEQKELVALAAQHHVAQVRGSLFERETLVHSDISAGNLRRTPEGNLAILDRGMYLKFSIPDRLSLKKLVETDDVRSRASAFAEWLWELPENQTVRQQVDATSLVDEIVEQSAKRGGDVEDLAVDALVIARSHGMNIPLKFTLLFKNLNALRQLAQQAGFDSLREALQYSPK